jgi:hypothetical protein
MDFVVCAWAHRAMSGVCRIADYMILNSIVCAWVHRACVGRTNYAWGAFARSSIKPVFS